MGSRKLGAVSSAVFVASGLSLLPLPSPLFPSSPAYAAENIATGGVREMETEAGNIVADAVREAGGADIALVPAAAFKPGANVPRPATADQAASLLEVAADEVVVLSLRGAQILAALERSVSFAPQPSAGFLQVSGVKFSYNASKAGGQRIGTATLVSGGPLEAAKTYKVATTRPLANGQQGYFQIWERDQITGGTGKSLKDALTERAGKNKGLSGGIEGRITRAGQ
ncbi:MAG: 5'-nucleotidase C-terminal domain-containing protein [Akkermansiaceae bacterium]|nr:5'-nucleotidase C-terminal domain-containing protein [Armatimonadota bacterium]